MIVYLSSIIKKYCTREIIAYLICGVLTTIVGLGIYQLCLQFNFAEVKFNNVILIAMFESKAFIPQIISVIIAIIFAYFVNKIFVFQSKSWALKTILREIIPFGTGRIVISTLETVLLIMLVDMMELPSFYCKVFTSFLVIVCNYFVSKFAVFKKNKPET